MNDTNDEFDHMEPTDYGKIDERMKKRSGNRKDRQRRMADRFEPVATDDDNDADEFDHMEPTDYDEDIRSIAQQIHDMSRYSLGDTTTMKLEKEDRQLIETLVSDLEEHGATIEDIEMNATPPEMLPVGEEISAIEFKIEGHIERAEE